LRRRVFPAANVYCFALQVYLHMLAHS
jgi:hypothetical protein